MHIGLTYDLRSEYLAAGYSEEATAEFDSERTVANIFNVLVGLGHKPDRIGHARRLCERLVAGDRWDLVFNICEGLHGVAREAQAPAILDLYEIPYVFSDPLALALTLHKGLSKRVVRDHGLATSLFAVVSERQDLNAVRFAPPYFVKPVAEGTGKGISDDSVVETLENLAEACDRICNIYSQPALVERFLTGREFTVGILGTGCRAHVLGTLEIVLLHSDKPGVYSYDNKAHYEDRVAYPLVTPADDPVVGETEALALSAWRALGCRDGGRVDIRCDEHGKPQFLEVNPLAGLHPDHSDLPILAQRTGMSYQDLIGKILASALERLD